MSKTTLCGDIFGGRSGDLPSSRKVVQPQTPSQTAAKAGASHLGLRTAAGVTVQGGCNAEPILCNGVGRLSAKPLASRPAAGDAPSRTVDTHGRPHLGPTAAVPEMDPNPNEMERKNTEAPSRCQRLSACFKPSYEGEVGCGEHLQSQLGTTCWATTQPAGNCRSFGSPKASLGLQVAGRRGLRRTVARQPRSRPLATRGRNQTDECGGKYAILLTRTRTSKTSVATSKGGYEVTPFRADQSSD